MDKYCTQTEGTHGYTGLSSAINYDGSALCTGFSAGNVNELAFHLANKICQLNASISTLGFDATQITINSLPNNCFMSANNLNERLIQIQTFLCDLDVYISQMTGANIMVNLHSFPCGSPTGEMSIEDAFKLISDFLCALVESGVIVPFSPYIQSEPLEIERVSDTEFRIPATRYWVNQRIETMEEEIIAFTGFHELAPTNVYVYVDRETNVYEYFYSTLNPTDEGLKLLANGDIIAYGYISSEAGFAPEDNLKYLINNSPLRKVQMPPEVVLESHFGEGIRKVNDVYETQVQNSLQTNTSTRKLELVGDQVAPAVMTYYGRDLAGTRGYKSLSNAHLAPIPSDATYFPTTDEIVYPAGLNAFTFSPTEELTIRKVTKTGATTGTYVLFLTNMGTANIVIVPNQYNIVSELDSLVVTPKTTVQFIYNGTTNIATLVDKKSIQGDIYENLDIRAEQQSYIIGTIIQFSDAQVTVSEVYKTDILVGKVIKFTDGVIDEYLLVSSNGDSTINFDTIPLNIITEAWAYEIIDTRILVNSSPGNTNVISADVTDASCAIVLPYLNGNRTDRFRIYLEKQDIERNHVFVVMTRETLGLSYNLFKFGVLSRKEEKVFLIGHDTEAPHYDIMSENGINRYLTGVFTDNEVIGTGANLDFGDNLTVIDSNKISVAIDSETNAKRYIFNSLIPTLMKLEVYLDLEKPQEGASAGEVTLTWIKNGEALRFVATTRFGKELGVRLLSKSFFVELSYGDVVYPVISKEAGNVSILAGSTINIYQK